MEEDKEHEEVITLNREHEASPEPWRCKITQKAVASSETCPRTDENTTKLSKASPCSYDENACDKPQTIMHPNDMYEVPDDEGDEGVKENCSYENECYDSNAHRRKVSDEDINIGTTLEYTVDGSNNEAGYDGNIDVVDPNGHDADECGASQCLSLEEISDYISSLEEDVLGNLARVLEDVLENESSVEKEASIISDDIASQCLKIKLQIDIAETEMLHDLSLEKQKQQRRIQDQKKELLKQEKDLKDLLSECKDRLKNGNEEMQSIFAHGFPRLSELSFSYSPVKLNFKTGVIDIPELRKEIGTLHPELKNPGSPLRTSLVSFSHRGLSGTAAQVFMRFSTQGIIQDIRTTSSNEAWITDEETHNIIKYNSTGEALKQVNSTCCNECFVMDKDGNFLVCNYWEDQIIKINQDGDVSVLISDLPAPPTGICINHEDDIAICMKGYRWIPIYSPDGKVKKKHMCIREPSNKTKDDDDEVFVEDEEGCRHPRAVLQIESPYRIIQNHRRDYIIVDGKYRYRMICLDENGYFRWKYICQQLEDVYPYNICCTKDDDILIADVEAQRFHVIDREGQFVTYIMFNELGLEDAWSMSIDTSGRLWTGQDDGKVNIIDLNLGLR